jgi:hypothetical protein
MEIIPVIQMENYTIQIENHQIQMEKSDTATLDMP